MRSFPTTRGTNLLPFFGSYVLFVIWPFFFVSFVMVPTIDLLLDFCEDFVITTWMTIKSSHGHGMIHKCLIRF